MPRNTIVLFQHYTSVLHSQRLRSIVHSNKNQNNWLTPWHPLCYNQHFVCVCPRLTPFESFAHLFPLFTCVMYGVRRSCLHSKLLLIHILYTIDGFSTKQSHYIELRHASSYRACSSRFYGSYSTLTVRGEH